MSKNKELAKKYSNRQKRTARMVGLGDLKLLKRNLSRNLPELLKRTEYWLGGEIPKEGIPLGGGFTEEERRLSISFKLSVSELIFEYSQEMMQYCDGQIEKPEEAEEAESPNPDPKD